MIIMIISICFDIAILMGPKCEADKQCQDRDKSASQQIQAKALKFKSVQKVIFIKLWPECPQNDKRHESTRPTQIKESL